jgi:hypothetical protein
MSLPWRMPWVGSWFSQNRRSTSSKEISAGRNTASTTSLCPVRPLHTSS